ncbi:putative PAS/PAC sensor protein [Beutenbergia cavernae DSM 12333]|uniref:Putative PAS/PAC sensor protein n=1 Tax=Beutenbergia cavernae (strain ATCC BAA-8 / DSM 12333 / CCUG 43141 / JCM 11478 / NBRC 16432 / NCIMB 13614 / HKI 0122) TaxID=471853 RepID=C5BXY5_BEUC1|nr:SpoIIE family protein phosphatase [Beutenbergia cavernae]ACQ78879.1 putative PAS/PAC sensor protein [Beutenbergia cavernae DSM 12333]
MTSIDDIYRAAQASQVSIVVTDAREDDEPIVWVNEAFTRTTGYARDAALGRNCRFLQGPATDPAAVARLGLAVRADEPVAAALLNYRPDGTPFWNDVSISPVRDDAGAVTHHVGVQVDVTARADAERERDRVISASRTAQRRLELLRRIGDDLHGVFDADAEAAMLPGILVPELADWAMVVSLDDAGRLRPPHVATVGGGSGPAHEAAAVLTSLGRGDLDPSGALSRLLVSDDGALLVSSEVAAWWGRQTLRDDVPAAVATLGAHHVVAVPLDARGARLGVLVLGAGDARHLDERDLATARMAASRAAVALDNARLYRRESSRVRDLQRTLVPHLTPLDGLEIATHYGPADATDVGGDWFDAFRANDGNVGIVIGDVAGHDLRAAGSMGQLRSLIRARAWGGTGPGRTLTEVDAIAQDLGSIDLSTCLYAHLERVADDDGEHVVVGWARAAHPPMLAVTPDGVVHVLDGGLSTPIGLTHPHGERPEMHAAFPLGTTLVLCTDGLVERREESLEAGLARLAAAVGEMPDAPVEAVRDHVVSQLEPEGGWRDDTTLVVARVVALPADGQQEPDLVRRGPGGS